MKKNKFYIIIFFLIIFFLKGTASYALDWQSTNIQYLRGHNYKIGEEKRSVITLEHANKWRYGDNYVWVDWIKPDGQKLTYYSEVSPRLSLSKISGKELSFGIIKDFLISTTLEKPNHRGPRYLYGGALDLDIPGFSYFKTNIYRRDDKQLKGGTWQMTLAWKYPFKIGSQEGVLEGFSDLAGGEGSSVAHQQFVPRLLFDAGEILNIGNKKLFIGMEWHYWRNKFGVKGENQSTPQAQIKWIF